MSQKTCFVTVGATAPFAALVRVVLSPDFCRGLEERGYTGLLVQYGQDGRTLYQDCLRSLQDVGHAKLDISGFGLDKSGLDRHLRLAKGHGMSAAEEGVVISHAGSPFAPPKDPAGRQPS